MHPRFVVGTFGVLALLVSGCHGAPKTFASTVQISRFDIVHTSADGKPLTGDIELEWTDCPGEQREVTRGGAEFVACMSKFKPGEKLPVSVEWAWDPEGFYDWDITKVGDCARPSEARDESSFDMVQECEEEKEQGATVGFHCNRVPQKELLEKCPWFRRR